MATSFTKDKIDALTLESTRVFIEVIQGQLEQLQSQAVSLEQDIKQKRPHLEVGDLWAGIASFSSVKKEVHEKQALLSEVGALINSRQKELGNLTQNIKTYSGHGVF